MSDSNALTLDNSQFRFVTSKPRMRHHTKSRLGCVTCKLRRVKCPEQKPICARCSKIRATCLYDAQASASKKPYSTTPTHLIQTKQTSNVCTIPYSPSHDQGLSSHQLELLYHFRRHALPDCLLGPDGAWVADILGRAHQYPHLMHAMLALGSSHFHTVEGTLKTPTDAILHRAKAFKLLSDATLSRERLSHADLEVILATTIILTVQASYMTNAFQDFIRLLRGCGHVSNAMLQGKQPNSNTIARRLESVNEVGEILAKSKRAALDTRIIVAAESSLRKSIPFCQSDAKAAFHQRLLLILATLRNCFSAGLKQYLNLIIDITEQPETITAELLYSASPGSITLQCHLLSIGVLLSPGLIVAMDQGAQWISVATSTIWIRELCQCIGFPYTSLVEWPLKVAARTEQFARSNWLSVVRLADLVSCQPELFL
ncbi:hypothetical protein DM02DRAFT_672385 [Periconia macrospinosa]|uniref:Zn(2)-C6 fungal-type domain-containing protein n=1 Tax=Periconia macrospinosa TaxID=97972 RepID=A0A2V1DP85_9PLEO|nr:hypothetical protein DM02DRAFT_672385 [Periconia macrospinosa]